MRCVRDWARGEGGEPGRWAGEQPVERVRLGTSKPRAASSSAASSSAGVMEGGGGCGIELARRVSARMPQTTAVSPTRTTALPEAWVREPVWAAGGRNSWGVRPEGRWGGMEGRVGWRCSRR